MIRLIERRFDVPAPVADAWKFLARVEEWPRWAAHIARVEMSPPGEAGPQSSGCIHLRNGIRSTFRMTEFNFGKNWKWVGAFLWLRLHYDHRFEAVDARTSRLTWIIDAEGFGAAVLGRIFARIYSRNLDKAIPALVAAMGVLHGAQPGANPVERGRPA